ncbi:integrase [Vibrio breoganii]|uniref:Tyrosine-type recombinase/integrase n=1 Tax=Vibrio breoganii TaxID=553239 RepID=A0ABX1U4Q6_9VIBR|nr:tyrosine-type recombinase/integrase [Vibrio breoganii]NMO72903.1 tyrosine-type recombinase/integrase [Vibrio breoganii]NMR68740.1 tyrosine-type recombinase/integrase [Vibrio breoganii]PMG03932.1 integrase [Vibrio breoganii]PML90990.1 integrase [Vibrio breoganii]
MISNTIKDVVFWTHVGVPSEAKARKPIDLPFLTYPNYTPCLEANAYMHHLAVLRNLKASTIRTYATKIVHLIRFIYEQPTLSRFSQLTNASFTLFIQNLTQDVKPNGEPKRSSTEVAKIGETCIQFLEFVSHFHNLENFIGLDDTNAITLTKKKHTIRIEGSNNKKDVITISHPALPTKGSIKTRHPVSKADALKIWTHIKSQKKVFSKIKDPKAKRLAKREQYDKRKRDMAIYASMEMIGGRVGELHSIRFSDYEEARRTGRLRIHTSKKRNDEDNERYVPVDSIFLEYIAQYIEVRRRAMKKYSAKHDLLFISLRDGQPFSKDSWTAYVSSWGKKLSIEGKVSPHLWRHARFTNWMVDRILTSQEINSKDDFRKNVLHTQQFKKELQQFSGHTLISSLDTYLDLAWEQLHGYTEVYSAASLKTTVNTMKNQVDYIQQRIERKELSAVQAIQDLRAALTAFEKDIDASLDNDVKT